MFKISGSCLSVSCLSSADAVAEISKRHSSMADIQKDGVCYCVFGVVTAVIRAHRTGKVSLSGQ